MEKTRKIYEGKSKIVYATDSPNYLIHYFKDDITCFNAAKRGTIEHKGIINNYLSAQIFEFLESEGIPTHYERILNDREVLVKKVRMIPLEVIIRNVAAGSLCRIFRLKEGMRLPCSILEYCYKDDSMQDPLVNEYHIRALQLATEEDLATIKRHAFQINDLLTGFFLALHMDLVDFKVEFGKFKDRILLADEVSPDTCRLWEVGTGEKWGKDRFRRDLGHVEEAYQEILRRVQNKTTALAIPS